MKVLSSIINSIIESQRQVNVEKVFTIYSGFVLQMLSTLKFIFNNHYRIPADLLTIWYSPEFESCNYQCEYCIVGWNRPDQKKNINFANHEQILEKIKGINRPIYLMEVVSGEPTISKRIMNDLISLSYRENIWTVYTISNLSISKNALETFLGEINKKKFSLSCTFHESQVKNKEEFVEKLLILKENKIPCCVGLVAMPGKVEHSAELKNYFNKLGFNVYVNGFQGSYNGKNYPDTFSPAEKEILRKIAPSEHEYEYTVDKKSPAGNLCYAGSNYIFINNKGNIHLCSHAANINALNPLGNILNDSLESILKPEPQPCPLNQCPCPNETYEQSNFKKTILKTRCRRIFYPKTLNGLKKYMQHQNYYGYVGFQKN